MDERSGILSSGFRILMRNKRYVVWFYLLNLVLAVMGALALQQGLGLILDKSLYSDGLLHGFDVFTFLELSSRPELAGHAVASPHLYFTFVFLFLSVLFMPGVLDAYSSKRRLSRDDFWATCGRNVWRFVRLFIIGGLITAVAFSVLTVMDTALGKAAARSSNEMLPFYVQLVGGIVIFLIMTWIRTWYDLAQADVVTRDEGRVRKSMRSAAGYAGRNLGRLLGAYVLISVVAVIVLIGGMWIWDVIVPPASVPGAFFVGQLILFLFLAARFWQRACAVAFCIARTGAMPAREQFIPAATLPQDPPITEAGPGI